MSNSYTRFCEKIEGITDDRFEWVKTVLQLDPDVDGDGALFDRLGCEAPKNFDNWPGFDWDLQGNDLFVADFGGHVDEENLILFLQAYLRKFDLPPVKLNFAIYTDKAIPGGFGGAWYIVGQHSVTGGNTWEDLHVRARESFSPKMTGPLPAGMGSS